MSVPEMHRREAPKHFKCAVLTISTSKAKKAEEMRMSGHSELNPSEIGDVSGEIALKLLSESGHEVVPYDVLPDERERIRAVSYTHLTLPTNREV